MLKDSIIKALLFTPGMKGRWGLPVLVEGPPGSGKTSKLEALSRTFGLYHDTFIGSIREPADICGMNVPDGKGGLDTPAPPWARKAAEAERAVIILDELNTCPPAVQAALLRVVLEGVVGDLVLPKTVRFVAAMNSTEDAAGGWDLAPPMANRFAHFNWGAADAEQWASYMLGGAGSSAAERLDAAAEEARVERAFLSPFAKATGLATAFLRVRPELLHKQPKSGEPMASKAWPSPRTWEMAVRALAGAEAHGLDEISRDESLTAFVGAGVAGEFLTWLADADLPDPAALLDGQVKFEHDPKRLDRTCAILSACAALVAPAEAAKRLERADVLWTMLGGVAEKAADVVVPAATTLCSPQVRLSTVKAARPVLAKLKPILDAAGLR